MYPFSPDKLVGLALYHIPFFDSRNGNKIPQDTMPPERNEIFTIGGTIIPTPIYVAEKSKKNLQHKIIYYYSK